MRSLERRVRAVEARQPAAISPTVKAWLGQPLTGAERLALGTEPVEAPEIDTIRLPADVRAWLGLEEGVTA